MIQPVDRYVHRAALKADSAPFTRGDLCGRHWSTFDPAGAAASGAAASGLLRHPLGAPDYGAAGPRTYGRVLDDHSLVNQLLLSFEEEAATIRDIICLA